MPFPQNRLRRLRGNSIVRELVRETELKVSDFIAPLFVVPGKQIISQIKSLPGQFRWSVDTGVEHTKKLAAFGVKAVLLFGIPEEKDEIGSGSWKENGIVQTAIRAIKKEVPEVVVITDLCFCEYTSHGHCGIVTDGKLDNDKTLDSIVKQTLSHAHAGADMIAPSGMIDGSVRVMRQALDESSFKDLPIMSYSAKFASSFYGPFREAVQSAPSFGDRNSYQIDPANIQEALREVESDINEGADIVMVKPALPYLDVIHAVKEKFGVPLAAYNVSGEYAMIKAAAEKGWIDGQRAMEESLLSIKRAGADLIISYFAEEFAQLRNKS